MKQKNPVFGRISGAPIRHVRYLAGSQKSRSGASLMLKENFFDENYFLAHFDKQRYLLFGKTATVLPVKSLCVGCPVKHESVVGRLHT